MTGVVTSWSRLGYGFAKGRDGIEYFLHATDFAFQGFPHVGERVEFVAGATAKGPRATSVRRVVLGPAKERAG